MIKAMIVDDERYAINEIEYFLKDINMINIEGKFTDPVEALDKINEINPDVVFLDIEMPQINGLDFAMKLIDQNPKIAIVFTTAFNDYAVEAFELYALDYVLKPIVKKRFDKTIQRIMKNFKKEEVHNDASKLTIRTFGQFVVALEGREPIKWRTEKTKELFAYLVYNSNKLIPGEIIIDNLFDYNDVERSKHQLYNGIYHIKKTIYEYGLDKSQIDVVGKYKLKLNNIELDFIKFKQFIKRSYRDESIQYLEEMEACYRGDFFEGMDWIWIEMERETLMKHYIAASLELSKKLIIASHLDRAESILLKLYQKEPYIEEITELLLEVYKISGRKDLAILHYKKYKEKLLDDLDLEPQDGIKRIIDNIKSK